MDRDNQVNNGCSILTASNDKRINSVTEFEECFKVDRKKYEDLLNNDSDEFFRLVMQQTNTIIRWPPKLKSGTKSKKDPLLRISGTSSNIALAKRQIFSLMDGGTDRVTIKMDVSFTDHSHIIGKGGSTIQEVMNKTNCHIHFPDSNRTSGGIKSNQVSIAGAATETERARAYIRQLLSLTFLIQVPLALISRESLERAPKVILALQKAYSLMIHMSLPDAALNSSANVTLSIRGSRSSLSCIRNGIVLLVEALTKTQIDLENYHLSVDLEIAVQHHNFVRSRENKNIVNIMQQTNTTIIFPNLPKDWTKIYASCGQRPKTAVSIFGQSFTSIYKAWELLLERLPISLIFDLNENQKLVQNLITYFSTYLDFSISCRNKQRQNVVLVTLRCAEKDCAKLFYLRRYLLDYEAHEARLCWQLETVMRLLSMYIPQCNVVNGQSSTTTTTTTTSDAGGSNNHYHQQASSSDCLPCSLVLSSNESTVQQRASMSSSIFGSPIKTEPTLHALSQSPKKDSEDSFFNDPHPHMNQADIVHTVPKGCNSQYNLDNNQQPIADLPSNNSTIPFMTYEMLTNFQLQQPQTQQPQYHHRQDYHHNRHQHQRQHHHNHHHHLQQQQQQQQQHQQLLQQQQMQPQQQMQSNSFYYTSFELTPEDDCKTLIVTGMAKDGEISSNDNKLLSFGQDKPLKLLTSSLPLPPPPPPPEQQQQQQQSMTNNHLNQTELNNGSAELSMNFSEQFSETIGCLPAKAYDYELQCLTSQTVYSMLNIVGLTKYADILEENNVGFKAFLSLADYDLQQFGIPADDRNKLLDAINCFKLHLTKIEHNCYHKQSQTLSLHQHQHHHKHNHNHSNNHNNESQQQSQSPQDNHPQYYYENQNQNQNQNQNPNKDCHYRHVETTPRFEAAPGAERRNRLRKSMQVSVVSN